MIKNRNMHIDAKRRVKSAPYAADLSGSAESILICHFPIAAKGLKAHITYSEASSADAGVALKLGHQTDDNHYFDETSEVSKSQWYTKEVTLLATDIPAGTTLILTNAGSKTGTGEVLVTLEYELVDNNV